MTDERDFVERAAELLDEGRDAEAETLLRTELGTMPADWSWMVDRGTEREIAFWDDAEYDRYVSYFAPQLPAGVRITWVSPAYPRALSLLATIADRSNRSDEAGHLVEQALALEGTQPRLLLQLAGLRERSGRAAEALALAERATDARAWATEADLAAARTAVRRLRIVLSEATRESEHPAAGDATPQPVRELKFATIDDTPEGSGLLARLLSRLESTTMRVVLVVAAITTVVLLFAAGNALLRTPPDDVRAARFTDSIDGYLALEKSEAGPAAPYRRGKVVIVNSDTRKVDPLHHFLDPKIRAERPDEVGTVVFVRWEPRQVDVYYDREGRALAGAYVTSCYVSVFDVRSKLRVAFKAFDGAEPATKITRLPNDSTDEYGPRPTGSVVDFIEKLPAVALDAEPTLIAGATNDAGPPIPPEAFKDVEFTAAKCDATGRIVERVKGTSRVWTETLPSGVSFEMVEIPGGTFQMGTPARYQSDLMNSGPQHDVVVPTFLIGRFEVTAELWRAVAALPRVQRDLDPNPSKRTGDARLPASAINWADANEFCLRLSQATGRAYRLPTEAEWEYACLGGGEGPYATGLGTGTAVANLLVEEAEDATAEAVDAPVEPDKPAKPFTGAPRPVGSYKMSNGYGLFDMDGNVAEWCLDAYHPAYSGAPVDGSAWVTGASDATRVCRGGSFMTYSTDAAAFSRFGIEPTIRYEYFGFRIALSIPHSSRGN